MEGSDFLKKLANRKIRRNYSIHPENVIFYDYFNNLKRKAIAQGYTNLVISFKKIMGSILKYPLPIKNSLEAYKLKGVGKRFSYYFEKALSQDAQEKKQNSIHNGCVTSNENSSQIYTHINKVITSVDRFLKELDNEVYNLRRIGEESDDSIMRNIKEIRNDYSNSDCNQGEVKRRKRKGGKEKKACAHPAERVDKVGQVDKADQTDPSDCANRTANHESKRGENICPPANELSSPPQLSTNSYTYKNSTNINGYTIISSSAVNYENSFLGDDEASTQKGGPPNERVKKKRFTGKNKESKKTNEIELNDFEKGVMTFLDKYEDLYDDCAVSKEEITIGFLKYYRNSEKINFRKLSRLIKLEFVEKVDIWENKASGGVAKKRHLLDDVQETPSSCAASNVLSPSSVSNAKRAKMKIVNKVRLTVKGREFLRRGKQEKEKQNGEEPKTLEDPPHADNPKPRDPTADAAEGEEKSTSERDKENKVSESNHIIKSEDSFKSAEYLSTKMNESEERLRKEITYSDGENSHLFGKGKIVGENLFDDFFPLRHGSNGHPGGVLHDHEEDSPAGGNNTKEDYSRKGGASFLESELLSKSEGANCGTSFDMAVKDQAGNCPLESGGTNQAELANKVERIRDEWDNPLNSVCESTMPWKEEKNDLANFELQMERKKKEIRKKLKISLREKIQKKKKRDENNLWAEEDQSSSNSDESEKGKGEDKVEGEGSGLPERSSSQGGKQPSGVTDGVKRSPDGNKPNGDEKSEEGSQLFRSWENCKVQPWEVNISAPDSADAETELHIRKIKKALSRDGNHNISEDARENVFFTIDGDTSDEQSFQLGGREGSERGRSVGPSTRDNLQMENPPQCNLFCKGITSNLSNNKQPRSDDVIDLFAEEGGDASCGRISSVGGKTEGKRKWSASLDSGGGELKSEPKRRRRKKKGEKRLDEEEKNAQSGEASTKKKRKNENDHTRGSPKGARKLSQKAKRKEDRDAHPDGDTHTEGGEQVTYGPYEIVMVIDNRDISGTSQELNEKMKKIFQRNGVKYLTRNLPLGDIIWLCRRRVYNGAKSKRKRGRKGANKEKQRHHEWSGEASQMSSLRKSNAHCSGGYDRGREDRREGDKKGTATFEESAACEDTAACEENAEYEEHVLKWIVERKTLNDLSASIIDGRYDEQKYRLMRSKETSHIIYLIENSNNSFKNYTSSTRISYETLLNAQHSIQLVSGFSILTSQSLTHTFFLLAEMHTEIVESIRLLANTGEGEPIRHTNELEVYLRDNASEWDQWNNDSKKSKNNLVKEVFGKQLRLINMCGPDATELILSLWPTPMKLHEALNRYTHDGILAEKIKRIYLKRRGLLGKRRVKSPVDANLIAQLRQLYAPDSI
ncbi:crossover junction endonuclease MUS81, putative [Plasmodium vivax]|nr:crossover junction endonuclease MUS81, putative [Plasmodium vivax]